jgi:hypothetical protein
MKALLITLRMSAIALISQITPALLLKSTIQDYTLMILAAGHRSTLPRALPPVGLPGGRYGSMKPLPQAMNLPLPISFWNSFYQSERCSEGFV